MVLDEDIFAKPPELIPSNSSELDELRLAIRECSACTARQEALGPVSGIGNKTGIVMIGRNPGRNENLEGQPFTGPSGQLLTKFLEQCGLTRQDIFLFNLIQCFTTDNRPPTKEEITTCVKLWVINYLKILQPYLVVTFGSDCGKWLAGISSISKEHGVAHRHKAGFWIIPCFHPGASLYDYKMRPHLDFDATQVARFLAHKDEFIAQLQT